MGKTATLYTIKVTASFLPKDPPGFEHDGEPEFAEIRSCTVNGQDATDFIDQEANRTIREELEWNLAQLIEGYANTGIIGVSHD